MHNLDSTSNLDFVLADAHQFRTPIVDISSDILTSNHLSFQFRLTYSLPLHVQEPKWFSKPCWNRLDLSLYQRTLDSMLSKIQIPFHFLCMSIFGNTCDLDFYLAEFVHSIKVSLSSFSQNSS